MSTTISDLNSSKVVSNLDTYVYTVPSGQAGDYRCHVKVPIIPPSGMSVTIKQNSSTVASFSSPAATQQIIDLQADINAVATDTIQVILASSTASDKVPNSFEAIINIYKRF
jgi:hypothetical protein